MKSRRKAREAALQALYQCDTTGDWSDAEISVFFEVYTDEKEHRGGAGAENFAFARALIAGVVQFFTFIDSQISTASARWSLNRMSRVDRNILRIAVFEMGFVPDIPVNVSINEAIEIAKSYGTDDSPMFVNGVLDNIAKVLQGNPALADQARAGIEKRVVNE